MNEEELTRIFRKLGAQDPAGWAGSQVREGIPQLARFVFLRQAWSGVLAEEDHGWIAQSLRLDPRTPGGGIAPALKRLKALGASDQDLTTVARVMQWELLFHLCYLLDDPGDLPPEVRDMAWRLFQVDDDGNPIVAIGGLHESVLETEPSGREIRGTDEPA